MRVRDPWCVHVRVPPPLPAIGCSVMGGVDIGKGEDMSPCLISCGSPKRSALQKRDAVLPTKDRNGQVLKHPELDGPETSSTLLKPQRDKWTLDRLNWIVFVV